MKRSRRFVAQMNVVPYIDVMLVLLIIFMVSAPMMQTGEIELPTVGDSTRLPEGKPLQVLVRQDGSLILQDGGSKTPVSLEELPGMLAGNPDTPVLIAGDRNVRYEQVVQVMDRLRRAGVKRLGLLVQTGGKG